MNLRQHLLLAMPHQEGFFENAVVVLCEHDEAGALGFVVNKPIKTDLAHILKEVQQDFDEDDEQTSIYAGGPVETERGFVLSPTPIGQSTSPFEHLHITGHASDLTQARDALHRGNALFVLGYAGWSAGQLDQEMADNAWLSLPYDQSLLFDTPSHKRFDQALAPMGISRHQLSQFSGQA